MGRQKLSPTQIRRIKTLLLMKDINGNNLYTHADVAKKYKVGRSAITKINLGMKNPMDKNGRWGDIEIMD